MRRKPSNDAADEPRRSGAVAFLVIAVVIDIVPLIAVAIDEFVLKTYWLARNFPKGSRAVFFDVYPFLRFLES